MQRRKLAWLLAGVLVLPAVVLAGAGMFLALSPEDYLLRWKLKQTIRVEVSSFQYDGRVVEVTEPRAIEDLVSAATARLEPRMTKMREGETPSFRGLSAIFQVSDGTRILFRPLEAPAGEDTAYVAGVAARIGQYYCTSSDLARLLESASTPALVTLGTISMDVGRIEVLCRSPTRITLHGLGPGHDVALVAVARDGTTHPYEGAYPFQEFFKVDLKPADIAAVRVTVNGKASEFKVPEFRYFSLPDE